MPNVKIPADRIVTIHSHTCHAELKIKLRNDSAWNAGLALATAEKELKLIRVKQNLYPIHLINQVSNYFILWFSSVQPTIHPGKMMGSERPNFIGPAYANLIGWAPLPTTVNNIPTVPDVYELLDDLINERPNNFYAREQLNLAKSLRERRAVVL